MAITQPAQTVTLTVSERTWRINIETAFASDPILTIFREVVKTDSANNIVSKASTSNPVVRHLSALATTSFTVGATTMTGQQLADFIKGVADQLRQADITAGIL